MTYNLGHGRKRCHNETQPPPGHHLIRLDVSDNPMTSEVAPALAACIRQQPNLKFLNLNDTSLTDEVSWKRFESLIHSPGSGTPCAISAGNHGGVRCAVRTGCLPATRRA